MDNKIGFELNDEALGAVSGGTGEGTDIIVDGTPCKTTDFSYWYDGERTCHYCGVKGMHTVYKFRPATGNPGELYICKTCGREFLYTRTVF